MKKWYPLVIASSADNDDDLLSALDATGDYLGRYNDARRDLNVGGNIERISSKLPGMTEQRFSELQDIEAILEYLETREKKIMVERTRHYLEHYQRALSDRVAREYAEASDEVQKIRQILQQVAYARNLYLGILKGFEYLHYQISNVVKLRTAGLEDAELRKD